MASQKHTLSRRSFLAASAATAAAAGLPTTSRARAPLSWAQVRELVPDLRAAYLAEVERLATGRRAEFESGELHGWHLVASAVPAGGAKEGSEHPCFVLWEELEEDIEDASTAYLVLACSPSEEAGIDDCALSDVRSAAAQAVAVDMFRAARARGWWRPGPWEYVGADDFQAALARKEAAAPSKPAVPEGYSGDGIAERLALPPQAHEAAEEAAAAADRFAAVVRAGGEPRAVARAARELHDASGRAAGLCAVLPDLPA